MEEEVVIVVDVFVSVGIRRRPVAPPNSSLVTCANEDDIILENDVVAVVGVGGQGGTVWVRGGWMFVWI